VARGAPALEGVELREPLREDARQLGQGAAVEFQGASGFGRWP
jgi:hypothetical protein